MLLDPTERRARGAQVQRERLGAPAAAPETLVQASLRDFLFAEVWERPGLDVRSRYLISIAGASIDGSQTAIMDGYVRGALSGGHLSQTELREAALHLAVYAGWTRGMNVDDAVTRVVRSLGQPLAEVAPIRAEPWDPQQRLETGGRNFRDIMVIPSPPPSEAYFEGGILNFVFGEMWCRPGLDQRGRRWITLVGVADSSSTTPIRSHTWSALASKDATPEEMREFVLQYAVHAGWPRASVMQSVVSEMIQRVANNQSFM